MAWSILWQHFLALALVWALVTLPGFALLPFLRLRIGLVGAPLVGVVYWTIALYLFPFAGGLDVALALIGVLAAIACMRARETAWMPNWRRWGWSTLILLVGSLPFLTTLVFHYVPFGMDGSMHSTAAALIGRAGGLPSTYAPFAPDLVLPPLNLGLPAIAGIAIHWGSEPAAAMLASHHLTFTILVLASYLLLRAWTHRTSAAVLAVVSVWMARASQASLEWGGFPTILSVAVGIFAARLLWQQARATDWRLALASGAAVAAIPLVHGVGGGTWVYCVGPWIALTALMHARSRLATVRSLALTGGAAGILLLVYRGAGRMDVDTHELEITHEWQQTSAPLGAWTWLSALEYTRKNSGSVIVVAGWIACGVLAVRCQWSAALLLGAAWCAVATVVANSRWWVLPASFLLYPERALYWTAPLSAAGLALVWRDLPLSWRAGKMSTILAMVALTLAGAYQNQFYQKIVREDFVNADGWEALVWARQHLDPSRDFVRCTYGTTGSFLPAFAQIGCTGAHHHHFNERSVALMLQRRRPTHVLVDHALAPATDTPTGTVVFHNRSITIVEIDNATAKRR